jgi:hypothetical protein
MSNQPLPLRALWSALGVTAYITVVAVIISNGERIFGRVQPGVFGPIAFLLSFIFSALVTSSLVFLRPIRLYLDGQKTEGVKLLFYTAIWLGVLTVLALIILTLV